MHVWVTDNEFADRYGVKFAAGNSSRKLFSSLQDLSNSSFYLTESRETCDFHDLTLPKSVARIGKCSYNIMNDEPYW